MPGRGLVMDGAMQQAPQPGRQATTGIGGVGGVLEDVGGIGGRFGTRAVSGGAGAGRAAGMA
jgi:hypothetical protein